MKNIVLVIITLLICIGGVSSTFFLLDRKSPTISIEGTPSLGCSSSFDSLMKSASAADDKGLKSFFVEEKSLSLIAENGYLTYVAIDDSNHVKKKQVSVDVDEALKSHQIEILQPMLFQVGETPDLKEYLSLKNGCGWELDEQITIEGVNFNKIGTYEAQIYSRKFDDIEVLNEEIVVDDLRIPKIILTDEFYEGYTDRYYSDDYFRSFIDHVEDDEDNEEILLENVTCDWQNVLSASQSGYVSQPGTYMITYNVEDSQGNIGSVQLRLRLTAPVVAEPPAEGE